MDYFVETAKGNQYPIDWIGVSSFDDQLRFELVDGADYIREAFEVFSNPEQTKTLVRHCFEDDRKFEDFIKFTGMDIRNKKNLVISLSR